MKKFFVLFCIPAEAIQTWMTDVDEATRKQQTDDMMHSWAAWMEENEKFIVDKGLPVGKTKRITGKSIADARNDINWYLVVQAESHEAATELLKDHPHLQIPSAYIDVSDSSRAGM